MAQAQTNNAAVPAKQVLLVVDDRMENLEAMQALLEDGEWQLRCASSGEEALRCLLEEDVGLVLLDVQMPGMDGFEVASADARQSAYAADTDHLRVRHRPDA